MSTDSLLGWPINASQPSSWVPQRQAAKRLVTGGCDSWYRLSLTQFRILESSAWTASRRSALPVPVSRCSAGQRSGSAPRFMFDLRRQERGLVPPELRGRRLAPGSLRLLPCCGDPFVDLVVTVLQIPAGAKREWRHRLLARYFVSRGLERQGDAEILAVSDVICSETSIKHSTVHISCNKDRRRRWHDTRVSTRDRLWCRTA